MTCFSYCLHDNMKKGMKSLRARTHIKTSQLNHTSDINIIVENTYTIKNQSRWAYMLIDNRMWTVFIYLLYKQILV